MNHKKFRILVAADLHGSKLALEKLPALAIEHRADILLLCGDITHMGRPKNYLLDLADRIEIPTFAIPGNCDPPQKLEQECRQAGIVYLHGKKDSFQNVPIVGWGGSSPHLFGGIFTIEEEEVTSQLGPLMVECGIFMSHNPPHGILDRVRFLRKHVGSRKVREIVDRVSPVLVLSGHIHEARGVEKRASTLFVNPGPAKKGHAALVKFADEPTAHLL